MYRLMELYEEVERIIWRLPTDREYIDDVDLLKSKVEELGLYIEDLIIDNNK